MEMIIVILIFSLLSLAATSLLAAALRVWKRAAFDQSLEETALALAEMTERREEARSFEPLELAGGKEDELQFVGLIHGSSGFPQMGEIHYWLDSGRLLRRERTLPEALKASAGRIVELAHSVDELKIQPLFFNEWKGEFQSEPVLGGFSEELEPAPDALRVTLRFKTQSGKSHTFERVIALARQNVQDLLGGNGL